MKLSLDNIKKVNQNYKNEIKLLKNKIVELENVNSKKIAEITEQIKEEVVTEYEEKYNEKFHTLYLSRPIPSVKERIVVQREMVTNQMNYNFPLLTQSKQTENYNTNNYGLNLETGWAQYFSSYNELVNPGEGYQDFNNLRIAALYDLNSEVSLGIEYRRENFYLIFNKNVIYI